MRRLGAVLAWTPVRPNISEGLAWLSEHAAEAPQRITAAQAYIAERHDPAKIGRQWAEAIAATAARRASPA